MPHNQTIGVLKVERVFRSVAQASQWLVRNERKISLRNPSLWNIQISQAFGVDTLCILS